MRRLRISHCHPFEVPYLTPWERVWWLLTRPLYIHPRPKPPPAKDDDPHATAVIQLMEESPEHWEFTKHTADYEGEPGQVAFRIWTANGEDSVRFYDDEEPGFTAKGKARVWKALKRLKAAHVHVHIQRDRELRDEVGLEDRVREKVAKLG